MLPTMRISPWFLVLALAAGCASDTPPTPIFEDADAWCDDEGTWWTFWAKVNHADGPRAVDWVVLEVALELESGTLDSVYLAELEYQADGEWSGTHENGTTALDCDAPEPYAYLFTAQDTSGLQGFFDYYESLE